MTEIAEPPLAPGACCDTAPCTCQDQPADPRLEEIHNRVQAATKGTWGTYYDGAVYHLAADMRVAAPGSGQPIGQIPDGDDKMQAFHNAMFIGRARDDVSWLVGELTEARTKLEIAERRNGELADQLEKYVGHEPTISEEMTYLNGCLNAVHAACDRAEKDAARWERPLPVPEWVPVIRAAASGGVTDEEPAGVPW